MNEKTKLLELFKKAADSADMFKDDKREVMGSAMLSEKGKKHEIGENRRLFAEAMEGYREQMLAIVDGREEDYTAHYVRIAQTRMGTSGYQSALTANLDMLKNGYVGKIEVMALLKLYKDDDLAYSQIEDIMHKTNNPYCNLLEDRVTVKKQLNAFESIRRVIKSKVNAYLTEQPVYKPTATAQAGIKREQFSRESSYFGSGYVAIVEELEEDLTITRPDATLALKNNSDTNMNYNPGSNVDVIRAEHDAQEKPGTGRKDMPTTQEEHLTDPATFPGMKQD